MPATKTAEKATKKKKPRKNKKTVSKRARIRAKFPDSSKKKKGGRPRLYETAEKLAQACDAYFKSADCVTFSGLCLFLEISKQTFYEYAEREEFKHVCEMARLNVENAYEKRLCTPKLASGAIFALKNLSDWGDKKEVEMNAAVDTKVKANVEAKVTAEVSIEQLLEDVEIGE